MPGSWKVEDYAASSSSAECEAAVISSGNRSITVVINITIAMTINTVNMYSLSQLYPTGRKKPKFPASPPSLSAPSPPSPMPKANAATESL